jgi:hypothetical protein
MTDQAHEPQLVTAGCTECRHFRGGLRCDAYPEGIPWPILAGDIDHLGPLPGDHGIQFEAMRRRDWKDRIAAFGYTIESGVEPSRVQLEVAWLRLSAGESPGVPGVVRLDAAERDTTVMAGSTGR